VARFWQKLSDLLERFKTEQAKGAEKAMLEELFNDFYTQRRKVYKMNFFRGIFFGLGSVLGGTIVLTIVVWILSLFVNFPVIGDYFQQTQKSLQQTSKPR
jgi:hypothetical protein